MATRNLFDNLLRYNTAPPITYAAATNYLGDLTEEKEERKSMWKFEIRDKALRRVELTQSGDNIRLVMLTGGDLVFSLEDLDTIREKAAEMLEANAALEEE